LAAQKDAILITERRFAWTALQQTDIATHVHSYTEPVPVEQNEMVIGK
jgi:hypothetical protein